MTMTMTGKNLKFIQIMMFYVLLSFILFPLLSYYIFDNTLESAGNGYVVGSIISLLLWQFYGKKLIR
jgi:hypothetical protein